MDIVERLGELRLGNKEYDAVVDAINEIEKLREKVFNLETEVHFDDQAIKSLQEIIERLRESLAFELRLRDDAVHLAFELQNKLDRMNGTHGFSVIAALKEGK